MKSMNEKWSIETTAAANKSIGAGCNGVWAGGSGRRRSDRAKQLEHGAGWGSKLQHRVQVKDPGPNFF